MKVTVVIPLYNKQNFIERAIRSLLSQDHESWNAIVVDDGSEDNGPLLVRSIRDPRIRLISQDNQGVSVARNRGIAEATTEWVAFLDADDEYLPSFLSSLIAFLERNPDQNLVMISGNQRFSNTEHFTLSGDLETGIHSYFRLCSGDRTPANSSNCLARRDALAKIGGFPAHMKSFEDWTCWMKIAMLGKFAIVNKVLSVYHSDDVDRASQTTPSSVNVGRDVSSLLNEGRNLLLDREHTTEARKELAAYLNRFIFRSAIPSLCRCGGGFGSIRPILYYNLRGFSLNDIRGVLSATKCAINAEIQLRI